MSGVQMAPQVAEALGPAGPAQVAEAVRRRPLCPVCARAMDPDVEDIVVRARTGAGNGPRLVRIELTHMACAPSAVVPDPELGDVQAPTAAPAIDTVAMIGVLHGTPFLACDAGLTASFDVGGQVTDAVSVTAAHWGFAAVLTRLEHLDPREVPLLRGWSVRLDGDLLRVAGPGPLEVPYEQLRNAQVDQWAEQHRPGPVLVLTGSGLAPATRAAGVGDWSASMEGARQAGRLFAARMPLRVRG